MQAITDFSLRFAHALVLKVRTPERLLKRAALKRIATELSLISQTVAFSIVGVLIVAITSGANGTIDENRFNEFVRYISPDASPKSVVAFKNYLAKVPPGERGALLVSMLQQSPNVDPGSIPTIISRLPDLLDSVDHLLDPGILSSPNR
jgi:hypothetical protein